MYVHHGMFYFHTMIQNKSQVPFDIDYIKFKVVDTQSTKRSPVQEIALNPVRTYHDLVQIKENQKQELFMHFQNSRFQKSNSSCRTNRERWRSSSNHSD